MADATYNLNGAFKPTMKRFADLEGPDFFPTPRWATFALIENEKFQGEIWESACGDGAMSRVLEETGQTVRSSDLYDRGYGETGFDFLAPQWSADNIVTNPPYNCAEGFVASGVKYSNRKFALLLRLAFLEGANRANTIFAKIPPARVWVFSERITFYPEHKVVFVRESGNTDGFIVNEILGDGDDLRLRFSFALQLVDAPSDSIKEHEFRQVMERDYVKAVDATLNAIRQMVAAAQPA